MRSSQQRPNVHLMGNPAVSSTPASSASARGRIPTPRTWVPAPSRMLNKFSPVYILIPRELQVGLQFTDQERFGDLGHGVQRRHGQMLRRFLLVGGGKITTEHMPLLILPRHQLKRNDIGADNLHVLHRELFRLSYNESILVYPHCSSFCSKGTPGWCIPCTIERRILLLRSLSFVKLRFQCESTIHRFCLGRRNRHQGVIMKKVHRWPLQVIKHYIMYNTVCICVLMYI